MCCVHPKQNTTEQTATVASHNHAAKQQQQHTQDIVQTSFSPHTHRWGENEVQGLLLLFWLCTTLTTSFTRPPTTPPETRRCNSSTPVCQTSLHTQSTINKQQTHTPHALKIPMRANSLHIQSTNNKHSMPGGAQIAPGPLCSILCCLATQLVSHSVCACECGEEKELECIPCSQACTHTHRPPLLLLLLPHPRAALGFFVTIIIIMAWLTQSPSLCSFPKKSIHTHLNQT